MSYATRSNTCVGEGARHQRGIAALLGWHEAHEVARPAVAGNVAEAHVLVEAHAVLTRLPSHTACRPPWPAASCSSGSARKRILVPLDDLVRSVIHRFVDADIAGGTSYDALVALTAMSHGLQLMTRNARAARTYDAVGADYELLGAGG